MEMCKNKRTLNAVGIVVALSLVGGTGVSILFFNSVYAQNTTMLGEPFFVEEGKITSQTEIGPNRTRFTFSSNGTMNGNIEVTNTATVITISKGNNLGFNQGKGVISTRDGSETANYTLIEVQNITQNGDSSLRGAAAYSTNSTGELSFLNNILGIFKVEGDPQSGNFVSNQWEWK